MSKMTETVTIYRNGKEVKSRRPRFIACVVDAYGNESMFIGTLSQCKKWMRGMTAINPKGFVGRISESM